eukprot:gene10382-biopygen19805
MGDILAQEQPQQQKALSRAVCARRHLRWTDTLDRSCREAGILAAASSVDQRALASESLLTAPVTKRQTIADTQYRILVKLRLGIPNTTHEEQCHTRSRDNPAQCAQQLTAFADHAFACAKTARQVTHDSVADLNAAFHREAGNRAWREAAVPEANIDKNESPIRADVLVRRGPVDPVECTEVKLRHPWYSSGDLRTTDARQLDGLLAAEEHMVKTKHSPVRVRSWVFTTLGRPGEQFYTDVRRLVHERLAKSDAQRVVSRESLRQLLLRRWRSEISCTIAIGVANTYLEAVKGTPPRQIQCAEIKRGRRATTIPTPIPKGRARQRPTPT